MIIFKNKFEPWQNLIINRSTLEFMNSKVVITPVERNTLHHLFVKDCFTQHCHNELPNEFKVGEIEMLNYENFISTKFDIIMWWHKGYQSFYMTLRKSGGKFSYDMIEQKRFLQQCLIDDIKCVEFRPLQ